MRGVETGCERWRSSGLRLGRAANRAVSQNVKMTRGRPKWPAWKLAGQPGRVLAGRWEEPWEKAFQGEECQLLVA